MLEGLTRITVMATVLVPLWLLAPTCSAEARRAMAAPEDLIERLEESPYRWLFRPRLVLRHRRDIGLSRKVMGAIREDVGRVQKELLDLRWKIREEEEKLDALLAAAPIDEEKAVVQAAVVMDRNREFKKAHLRLLIRVRNRLSEEQREALHEIRRAGARSSSR